MFVLKLLTFLKRIEAERPLIFNLRITLLEMAQPWRYRSWNRKGEEQKPDYIPVAMQI